eukprot:CAMPEP_0206438150 /NCGR_PEP_ID=MMETSP0324_2-20121206/11450_1 /ASSEMBLY_ACC=CAM_ASM_000836 /TAXON_ID=2866 /ORGANISM="Crypthecodinium cohnii, Strain Seligo" /LENGTH=54 /DNA_ID=CAMNT_0053905537 /DNA_START=17 /DNA_END=181 /DNA_ORIENTATION=-
MTALDQLLDMRRESSDMVLVDLAAHVGLVAVIANRLRLPVIVLVTGLSLLRAFL